MEYDKRCGFTLIEMLVVVILIGILSAGVLYAVSRARESGYASKCRANLRNLAQGVHNLAVESNGELPFAIGYEVYDRRTETWSERRGWVNWVPKAGATAPRPVWPNAKNAKDQNREMQQPPWFGPNGMRGIREGTLWSDGAFTPLNMMDISSYCCPRFKRRDVCGRKDAVRSYAMNRMVSDGNVRGMVASRRMLFAEIPPLSKDNPADQNGGDQRLDAAGPNGEGSTSDQPPYPSPYESIGFNHRVAGVRCGHVVFVSGHVELARMLETGENPTLGLAKGTR